MAKSANASSTTDIFFLQEVARDKQGWDEADDDTHHWITFRGADQWRGTAVGIANDIYETTVAKKCTTRGILVLVKLKNRGRVVLGSLHAHTGVTNKIYQAAVDEFLKQTASTWRHYPCIVGTDLNESIKWGEQGDVVAGSANLNYFLTHAGAQGWIPIVPLPAHQNVPTHYPRDTTRVGHQIDAIWTRQIATGAVHIDPEARHRVGTDHALLTTHVVVQVKPQKWPHDSRARYVVGDLPQVPLVDFDDVAQLAREHTKPLPGEKVS